MKKLIVIILTAVLILNFAACENGSDELQNEYNKDVSEQHEKDETKSEEKNNDYSSVVVGDIIEFGGYNWRVLDIQDGKVLIISEDILENQVYNTENVEITWEYCGLRSYLNGEFYKNFSSAEQGCIVETTVINSDNTQYGVAGGNNTTDKIFLLSIDEAKQYLKDNSARIAYDISGDSHWWWLRSPGYSSICAASVSDDGYVNVYGVYVYFSRGGGVRPALWLNLS
ncbi:MAG: DUF6273 domain-containing protein [Oscillospiraceae bacterium]|nr:DUF6273 domain-containing protein [Oscillospiraceae bacterium]